MDYPAKSFFQTVNTINELLWKQETEPQHARNYGKEKDKI